MADDEKESEATPTRGADWEVVQLTESTYAAAPGPKGFGPDDERNKQESSGAMFMSGHFVFPPTEHENVLVEPEIHGEPEVQDVSLVEEEGGGPNKTDEEITGHFAFEPTEHENVLVEPEIHGEPEVQDVILVEEEGGGDNKTDEEITQSKSDDDPQGIQFFDNGSSLSVRDMEFEEGKGLQELNLIGEEQSTYVAPEPNDPSHQNLDSPQYTKANEEDKYDGSGLPCEAWWKRHAACFYRHVKETNTFWSVFVAAALTGLVILGKRWQQEKWQLQQLKWHINDERLSRMMEPIGRFKDVLVGGHRRSPGGASASL